VRTQRTYATPTPFFRAFFSTHRTRCAGQTVGKKDGATAPAGKRLDEVLFSY